MKKLTNFPYKHVLVLGLAKSGTAVAKLLLQNGITIRINDWNTQATDPIVAEFKEEGAEVIVGAHPLSVLDGIDLVVKNPGIPYTNPIVAHALAEKIPIVTEVELAANLARGHEIIGITGSNGKTTTTTLVHEMLKLSNEKVQLAGNIGIVASEVAQSLTDHEKLLLELSSFQLLGVLEFKPKIAALLNLFDAHLDYHGTVEEYVKAKANIFVNQTEEDYLVYNLDDDRVNQLLKSAKSTCVPFSRFAKQIDGAWLDEAYVYFKTEKVIARSSIALVGEHNLENILAAVAISKLSGATNEGIERVLTTFRGVKHRLQFVKELNGRLFYNDSKATNILATQKALQAFEQSVILLAGGLDRGDTYEVLLPDVKHVKAAILFGETKEKLQATFQKAKIEQIVLVEDVKEATLQAYELSAKGDVILLSPACASWDQYRTFEERGDMFIQTVHTLA